MSEERDNSGAVFVNDHKQKDTHPDRKGSAKINGVDYWVSGWLKKDRNGKQFLSLSFTEKQDEKPKSRQREEEKKQKEPEINF